MSISFSGKVLNISEGKTVEFLYDIEKKIIFGDLVVVLLDIPDGVKYNENIFGVSISTGEVKWQVEKIIFTEESSSFIDIEKKINKLQAYNWSGIRVIINMKTGKIAHKRITK